MTHDLIEYFILLYCRGTYGSPYDPLPSDQHHAIEFVGEAGKRSMFVVYFPSWFLGTWNVVDLAIVPYKIESLYQRRSKPPHRSHLLSSF